MIAPSGMDNEQLDTLIRQAATEIVEGRLGFWKFEYSDSLLFVITDQSHNRMRAMTPITKLDSISPEEIKILLSANFDRALDARYCVNDDVLWSAYLHPLAELRAYQFLDAISQVATLSKNFGTSFTSSDIVFGG